MFGSFLVTGEKTFKQGFYLCTYLAMKVHIGFGEAIVARPSGLRFKQKPDLNARKFNSLALKKFVARAHVFFKNYYQIHHK